MSIYHKTLKTLAKIKKLLSLRDIYLLNFTSIIIDRYIIYSYIILNLSNESILNLFAFSNICFIFSILFSGFVFDKFGRKSFILLLNLVSILKDIFLILSFLNIKFIIIYSLITQLPNSFLIGKNEAIVYQDTINKNQSSFFAKNLSIFYLFTDVIKVIGINIATMIISLENNNYIIAFLLIIMAIRIISIPYLLKIYENNEIITKNYDLIKYLKILWQSTMQMKRDIILFAIYTSISMGMYKEILIIITKIYNLDHSFISKNKLYMHICMIIGCFVPIIFKSTILQKYKKFIQHYLPILIFSLMLWFYVINNPYGIVLSLCLTNILLCTFEVTLDFDIDKTSRMEFLGMSNSIIWSLSIVVSTIFSIVIIYLNNIFNIAITLGFIIAIYLIAMILTTPLIAKILNILSVRIINALRLSN